MGCLSCSAGCTHFARTNNVTMKKVVEHFQSIRSVCRTAPLMEVVLSPLSDSTWISFTEHIMVKPRTVFPFLLAFSFAQPGFLQQSQVLFWKYFLTSSPFFQGYKSFSNNSLWNKIIHELKSIKEAELKDDQMNYHVDEYIDGVIKRGGDGFHEQPRKNGLRYFIISLNRSGNIWYLKIIVLIHIIWEWYKCINLY